MLTPNSDRFQKIAPRICMLIYRFYPIIGGAEIQALQLAKNLVNEGYPVTVVTRRFNHPKKRERLNKIHIKRIRSFGTGSLGVISYGIGCFHTLLKDRKVDIIHVHGAVGMGLIGLLSALPLRSKVICKISVEGKIRELNKTFCGRLILKLYKKTDAIICISAGIRKELEQINFPKNKLFYIPNSVNTVKFSMVNNERKCYIRSQLNIPQKFIATFTGRLVKGKGLDVLLKAWKMVYAKYPDILLLILGSGNLQTDSCETEIRKFVTINNLNGCVDLRGNVDNVQEYLQASDVYIFPSRKEGSSNALIEAMACGLPIIASNISENAELITHEENGLLFKRDDPYDLARQITLVMADYPNACKYGVSAHRKAVSKFSLRSIFQKYEPLYRSLT